MPEHHFGISDKDNTSPVETSHSRVRQNHHEEDRIAILSSYMLDRGDSIIYAIVGICFFLGALVALGYSFWDFGSTMFNISSLAKADISAQAVVANAIIKLVSDLLLVLIIMEVLSTVIHYLKEHATSLRPFLFIGIVSATRGILSIGARLSVQSVKGSDFTDAMIELGVNAAVILALGITLKLLGKFFEDKT
ncbi:MAG: phosphate-starvation-inducible PsiE family protein [Chloroflexi bacterium]|nr:phosphate-starvation-inducible PsiE family protein [Chloroflexota bacterium]